MAAIIDVKSQQDVDTAAQGGQLVLLHFWASWCEPCSHMDLVLKQVAGELPQAKFLRVEAEVVDEVTVKYGVATVPFFVFIKGGQVVDTLEGADPAALTQKATALAGPSGSSVKAAAAALAAAPAATSTSAPHGVSPIAGRIKYLLSTYSVIVFMKGNQEAPVCGFSGRVVKALQQLQVSFKSVDILVDEELRQGLKDYSNWPTYPQLYVKGELVGGCDIVTEMAQGDDLRQLLADKLGQDFVAASAAALRAADGGAAGPSPSTTAVTPSPQPQQQQQQQQQQQDKKSLEAKLKQLVNQQPVMLFMKGNPQEPRCGFSLKVVEALKDCGVQFGSFDILGDESVRQGLKDYSNWPTYPQLYVRGELLGGCDIILEMKESGELKSTIESQLVQGTERLKQLVNQQPVMLFMKGNPQEPRCGFSRKVAEALTSEGIEFGSFDILQDESVRQGLKDYSNWPTYPQLYVRGELLGGCDIILEMKANGELKTSVEEMLHRMDVP